jgi:hypothetical protein
MWQVIAMPGWREVNIVIGTRRDIDFENDILLARNIIYHLLRVLVFYPLEFFWEIGPY